MARVLSQETSLAYAIEASTGVLPGSPVWRKLEPNNINSYGASINTVVRNPISTSRQRKKGTITDLDSAAEFDADLTISQMRDVVEGFLFARFTGPLRLTFQDDGLAATGTGFTYTEQTDSALAANTLVFARGFANAANNGLHVVDSSSTDSFIDIVGSGTEAETVSATQDASVAVCGVRGATGDLEIDGSGNLISTTLDLSTLDLTVGQTIFIGGVNSANRFASSENYGYARVLEISANELRLDKKSDTYVTDSGAGRQIDILFGQFCRNVTTEHADYIQRSYHLEASFPNLGTGGATEYEYAVGNFCDALAFNLTTADKATTTVSFVGTDSEAITSNRKTGADTAVQPAQTTAFNTTSDVGRLRVTELDETGLSTDFKSMTVTVANNVSPEKVIGNLGARFMNAGNFEVDIDAQLLFVSAGIPNAIRANTTLTMDFSMENTDGAMFVDLPAVTVGGGDREYPSGESVLLNATFAGFQDTTLGFTIGVSFFPVIPDAS